MATTSQRRSSRLAPSQAAPEPNSRAPRKRKQAAPATASAPKKQRAQGAVLDKQHERPSNASVKAKSPALRRSTRTTGPLVKVVNSMVEETDEEDDSTHMDTAVGGSDDGVDDSNEVTVAPRSRAARVPKNAKVTRVESTASSLPSRRSQPTRVKTEPKEEQSIKTSPRLRTSANNITVKKESGSDNSSDDFVDSKDVKKLKMTPTKTVKPVARLNADGDLASSESDDIGLSKGRRAKRSSTKPVVASSTRGKRAVTAKGKRKQMKDAAVELDSDDDDSSDFVAGSSSSDDDQVTNWAAALKSKAARGKDLIEESSSSSSSDDDNAPLKPKKKAQPPSKPKQAGAGKRVKKDGDEGSSPDERVRAPVAPTEYPHYEVAYAPTGRSRCKTCEKTLVKGELIVSIRLRHSRFGIMAYSKHVECTLLNDQVPKELHGFEALDGADVERVRAYLALNTKRGVEDERVALGDDAFIKRDVLPAGKPSMHLTAALLPYQQEGLAWMKAQEASKYRGGILADEMGMGKTIQAIATMLENVKEINRADRNAVAGGTLIICPVIACMQWKSEIERFVEANHLTILVYHGPKRSNLTTHLASYDVVLTTYSILESEGRKLMEAEKVACAYCGKLFVPEKLVPHNKYFCGPDSMKTAKQMKQQKGKSKTAVTKKVKKLNDSDNSENSSDEDIAPIKRSVPPPKKPKKTVKQARSPLHEVEWTRIILDEAHYIKDKKCSTARSVFRLKSLYKWCLSGTPLQNRIGELFSLVRFLQVDPQAYYECAECDCKQLDFSIMQGHCKYCNHTAMQHYSFFNKKIVIPIQGFGYVAEGKLAMLRLQNDLLRHVLLRRTKESRADDISLPPKLVRVRRDALDEREKDFYESIYTQSKAQFNTYVSAGTLLNNYAHIFDLLIRLRQAVDHPYLVIYSKVNPALQVPTPDVPAREDMPLVAPGTTNDNDKEDDVPCGFCHEPVEQEVESACRHVFCKACVEDYVESLPMGAPALCPTCDDPLTVDISTGAPGDMPEDHEQVPVKESRARHIGKSSLLRRLPNLGDFQSSTKIEALMEELHLMREDDPSAKAIVFSQFVNMLDLIEHRLHLAGMKCAKLSGGMPMAHRDRLLTEFREDPALTVFLISLKAGGVALNLTVASHIFLMDPWWNPAAEHQAIDRTHRLGQFKPIRATRFVIANTIEERILKLQEKKQLVFEGTVGSSTAALARLTIEDLRFLFSG
ncbi:hypothetical protein H310_06173 [Aphanomyces invadans]|uniref:DNA repair protein RAD16 n=1 Tax=Aphanomyces invadans TaxID=157072 RepID=A0A024U5H5_9STRA|nr:hypothetical protein H310_06173 [Aphanomyces invadans]ETW01509.1 hypothetical protein H310_06173 [Aphanomyces invadans]|eukprot:XP_008869357.1 hypothetical protein H310_06173 [Aphanomyces invadans]